jgi:subtilase family serine protease
VGRTRRQAAATVLAGCVIAASTLGVARTAQATPAAATVPVAGSAAGIAAAALISPAPAAQRLTVQVWLAPDLVGATGFADAVATPGSSRFHRYLSPAAYAAEFGPSSRQVGAVTAWLAAAGLAQVRASAGRDYVSATGTVAKIQATFGVRINRYRIAGAGASTVALANDRAASVPAPLAADVLAVTGLSNVPPATGTTVTGRTARSAPACSHYWAQYTASLRPAYRGLAKAALRVCGYSASQLRAAYGVTGAATGKGQTVAVAAPAPPVAMFQTLTDFARVNHLPAPRRSQYREQAAGQPCTSANQASASAARAQQPASAQHPDDEAEMDSEAVYAMAPGAAQLMLYPASGCLSDQSLLDTDLTVLAGNGRRPSASIVTNSWVIGGSANAVHAMALRAAAEGVGLYFASGDGTGTWEPAADPYVTAVGGTTLGIGTGPSRLFETGWSDDAAILDNGRWSDVGAGTDAAGGGVTPDFGQPAYQKGVVPASMSRVRVGNRVIAGRAVPDIAADADPDSAMMTGYTSLLPDGKPGSYQTEPGGGTSQATPLIAGLVADAQQGQPTSFGFINPLLYRLAGTAALRDILPFTAKTPLPYRAAYAPASGGDSAEVDVFDAQGRAYTQQVTARGYDTMTGVGAPNGAAFIVGLRRLTAAAGQAV